ncbi:hypothetical protein LTR56_007922 [Elasticomyces elasticus]|nr:hypothetical protein LTR56_007922 [Elasticomyces elasticus]KAK4908110.1 hypothetical protein LTR49_022944 [Elasticomyces elasticus]
MAATAALATFELLEGILIQLDFNDLLAARSVSSEWRSITERSLHLRKLLFLATVDSSPLDIDIARSKLAGTRTQITLTGQPLEVLPLFPHSIVDDKYHLTWDELKDKRTLITDHTAVSIGGPLFYSFYWPLKSLLALDSRLWRDMQLTQPACAALSIELYGRRQGGYHECFARTALHVSEGIKLGVIADTAKAMMKDEEGHGEIVVRLAFTVHKGLAV